MRKRTALLAVVAIVGCKDSPISVELKGQPTVLAPPRYQIIMYERDATAFLLDTQRGRVWSYYSFDEKRSLEPHFYPITIVDGEGGPTIDQWLLRAIDKADKAGKSHE